MKKLSKPLGTLSHNSSNSTLILALQLLVGNLYELSIKTKEEMHGYDFALAGICADDVDIEVIKARLALIPIIALQEHEKTKLLEACQS